MKNQNALTRRLLTAMISYLLFAGTALSEPAIFATDGGAIRSYDAVAFFIDDKAVLGLGDFRHKWRGATWYFANERNLALFRANPKQYAPQYGGYCAYAMSKGSYAPTDPEAWTIHDGKLYLNFSKAVRRTWAEDIPGNIARADQHWARFNSDGY